MQKIGAAIVGCGSIHRIHADALSENDNVNILWFVDIDEEKAKESAAEYGGKYTGDIDMVLEDESADVIHICTPHYLHSPMAIEALRSGKHVFLEKPLSISSKEADLIKEAVEISGKILTVCFQNRYNLTSQKAKEIIDSNSMGKILGVKGLVTWSRGPEYYTSSEWRGSFAREGGGVLINQSIHTLDLMQWLVGDLEYIEGKVSTRTLKDVIEVEDTAEATLFFKNGARGIFYATNSYTSDSPIELEIHLEKGKLRIADGQLTKLEDGKLEVLVDENADTAPYKSYWGNSHAEIIADFYNNLLSGELREIIPVEEAKKSIVMIEAIYRSSSTGNKIKIN